MSKEKIKIASSSNGYPYWTPMTPIVEFCLERGCKIHAGGLDAPFYEDKNGSSSCSIIGPVTIQDILDHFELPDHFKVGSPFDNSISDTKHRSEVSFTSFEKFEAHVKEAEALDAKYAKQRAERRRRIEERKKLKSQASK